MPTFTLLGDESGDVGMSFGKGASRNFELTMMAIQHPDELWNGIEVVRKNTNLSRNYQFKFHSLTSTRPRQDMFMARQQMDFSIWAAIADRTCLPASFQTTLRIDFYLYFVAELPSNILASVLKKSTLILDEFGSLGMIRTALKKMIRLRGVSASFKRLAILHSRDESGATILSPERSVGLSERIVGWITFSIPDLGLQLFEWNSTLVE